MLIYLPQRVAKKGSGGHNKEIIMLTIKCFKSLCLKARTKKADEIHDYFIKLEQILHEIIEEESNELRLQLEQKEQEIEETKLNSEKEKLKVAEKQQYYNLVRMYIFWNN